MSFVCLSNPCGTCSKWLLLAYPLTKSQYRVVAKPGPGSSSMLFSFRASVVVAWTLRFRLPSRTAVARRTTTAREPMVHPGTRSGGTPEEKRAYMCAPLKQVLVNAPCRKTRPLQRLVSVHGNDSTEVAFKLSQRTSERDANIHNNRKEKFGIHFTGNDPGTRLDMMQCQRRACGITGFITEHKNTSLSIDQSMLVFCHVTGGGRPDRLSLFKTRQKEKEKVFIPKNVSR